MDTKDKKEIESSEVAIVNGKKVVRIRYTDGTKKEFVKDPF